MRDKWIPQRSLSLSRPNRLESSVLFVGTALDGWVDLTTTNTHARGYNDMTTKKKLSLIQLYILDCFRD